MDLSNGLPPGGRSNVDLFGGYQPSYPPTRKEKLQSDLEASRQISEIGLTGWSAASQDLPLAWIVRQFTDRPSYDPNFQLTEEKFKRATDGLHPSLWTDLARAQSDQHLELLRLQAFERQTAEQKLASMGWEGAATRMAVSLFDPVYYGVAAATGGLGEAIGLGGVAGRLGGLVRGGFVGATTGAVVESYLLTQDNHRTADDVLYMGLTGLLLGGTLGATFHGRGAEIERLNRQAERLRRTIEYADIQKAAGTTNPALSPKGESRYAEQISVPEPSIAEIDDEVFAVIARQERARLSAEASKIARTPLDKGGGVGFLPPIVAPNQVTGWIAESPHARLSFESARADANTARRANLDSKVVVVEYPGGGFAAFRERSIGEPKGIGPDIAPPPSAPATPPKPIAEAPGINASTLRGSVGGTQGLKPEGQTIHGLGAASPSTVEPTMPPRPPNLPPDLDYSYVSNALGYRIKVLDKLAELPIVGPLVKTISQGIGMTDMLVHSPSPSIRIAARVFGEEVVPNAIGEAVIEPTSMKIARYHGIRMYRISSKITPLFEEWAERRGGMNALNQARYMREFSKEVTMAGRKNPGAYTADPSINAAADHLRTEYAQILKHMQDGQVKGFADIPESKTYVPRVRSKEDINTHIERFGLDTLRAFVGRAINDWDKGTLTPRLRDAIAKAWLNVGEKLYTEAQAGRLFSKDMTETLRNILIEGGADESTIADIMHALKPDSDAGLSTHAHRRIDFDESYAETLTAKDGTRHEVRFSDLLENDAFKLIDRYSRQAEGLVVSKEGMRPFSSPEGPPIDSIQGFLSEIERRALSEGHTPTRTEMAKIDALVRHSLDIPQEPGLGPVATDILRTTRKIQHLRLGGLMTFSQLADFGGAIGETGVRTMLEAMPTLRGALREITSGGRIKNELLEELRTIGTLGNEIERGNILNHVDLAYGSREAATSTMQKWLDKGVRIQANVTLLTKVIQFAQKTTVSLAAQKWATLARTGNLPTKLRLAAMGLVESDARDIYAAIMHPTNGAKFEGPTLVSLNLDRWDPATRAKFAIALDKFGRRTAQTNDIGQMSLWMTTEAGKMVSQFRVFPLVALSKQFRFNLRMHDFDAFFNMMTTMFIGTAAYIAREYAGAIGRDDRTEYLKKRLAPEMLAKAAFSRAGFSSIFPSVIDAVGRYSGIYDPLFGGVRSTGLAQDPIFGNPTWDFFEQVRGVPKSLIAPFKPSYQFSQEDVRALRTVIPFQNALGVKNILDALQTRLPGHSEIRE